MSTGVDYTHAADQRGSHGQMRREPPDVPTLRIRRVKTGRATAYGHAGTRRWIRQQPWECSRFCGGGRGVLLSSSRRAVRATDATTKPDCKGCRGTTGLQIGAVSRGTEGSRKCRVPAGTEKRRKTAWKRPRANTYGRSRAARGGSCRLRETGESQPERSREPGLNPGNYNPAGILNAQPIAKGAMR